MWDILARFILRKRVYILIGIAVLTGYMGYRGTEVKLQWDLPKLLPDHDTSLIQYEKFKEIFGEEQTAYMFAIDSQLFENRELFNAWWKLGNDLEQINGVSAVFSAAKLFELEKDTAQKKFNMRFLMDKPIETDAEFEAMKTKLFGLPFYKDLIYNDSNKVSLMLVPLSAEIFKSKEREPLITAVMEVAQKFEKDNNVTMRYSGMPYIRATTTHLVKSELFMFIFLALGVTFLILTIFFRSGPPVLVSMLIVALGVVWSFGVLAILGFEVTILTSIIPPLIIVIGIPNSIYLINKYHAEYLSHGNKILAISRVIKKIGQATLMTNLTTAIGFLAFVFTDSAILVEFGIVASINILVLFVLSIFLIPAIFSFLNPPKASQTKHLNIKWVNGFVDALTNMVSGHRTKIYWVTAIIVALAINGVMKIETTGNLVDDLPKDHTVVSDLKFFEDNFTGVMPLEIFIDGKKPGMAMKSTTLKRMEKLEELISTYPEFSRPISVVDGLAFVRQSYFGGLESQYKLPSRSELSFMKPYFENEADNKSYLTAYIDTTGQYARLTSRMEDVGTKEMDSLIQDITPKIHKIFPAKTYTVELTGASPVYLNGTNYLVNNLFTSLLLAIFIIGGLMSVLFRSVQMVMMSIIINLIPLLFTGGMMGYLGIPIKPSTILVFSIAFGISIDDTIHFLAKYRQELVSFRFDIKQAVLYSIKDTGVSMMYTSIILFFGFSVFASSQFGGTQALGFLVSITLFIAMLVNLVVLPSFLLTMDKRVTTKAFSEPFFEIYDEEEDIDYNSLTIKK